MSLSAMVTGSVKMSPHSRYASRAPRTNRYPAAKPGRDAASLPQTHAAISAGRSPVPDRAARRRTDAERRASLFPPGPSRARDVAVMAGEQDRSATSVRINRLRLESRRSSAAWAYNSTIVRAYRANLRPAQPAPTASSHAIRWSGRRRPPSFQRQFPCP
jgi:hypothetical protein